MTTDETGTTSKAATRGRSTLPLLFSIVMVDLIGFGIVMPVLPFYARELGADGLVLGLLLTGYAAAQFVCAPLWGRLSDRIGRRPVMLATVAGSALSLVWLGFAGSLGWIFVARILGGAFAANISVASAYIADVTDEDERTRWMGMLGASFGVGFLLGPAIGGALGPLGYAVPMLAAAGLAAANFVYAAFVLQEPERSAVPATPASATESTTSVQGRLGPLRDPVVRRLCLSYFAFSVAVTQLETVFAFFMMDRFGYGVRDVAFILVLMAVVMGGIQGGGMRALAARFEERLLVVAGSLLLAISFGLVPFAPTVALLLVPLVVSAGGRAIAQPSMMSLVSMAAPAAARGAVMGSFTASASLARVVGPILAGALYDQSMSAPFWLASGLLVVVSLRGFGLPARGSTVPVDAAETAAS